MRLTDLRPLMARRRDGALSFDRFRTDPTVAALRWPDDVLEQFLFDHGDNLAFVDDYNTIDLHTITWQLETIPAAHFTAMPTGASDEGCIENYAETRCTESPSCPRRSPGAGRSGGRGCARRS
ncbi:hypothetical protein ABT007_36265 [Streptomyces griseus]|uniref:hypothetical protein n=1 Tax=Streptomyces griseus TaxID=1911 RepID=UPI0033217159